MGRYYPRCLHRLLTRCGKKRVFAAAPSYFLGGRGGCFRRPFDLGSALGKRAYFGVSRRPSRRSVVFSDIQYYQSRYHGTVPKGDAPHPLFTERNERTFPPRGLNRPVVAFIFSFWPIAPTQLSVFQA
ncbi:hypothetical protein PISMIDRAFT_505863 [Pisolithus microcarpus 441]|uniref:Uncharacterized protein n=1 Tax=Pisolithus microcarpus 441 TaxID=765257 RepID=A0A0C9ZIL5_9AGAM|nr:hypothetical protein PISMIDRAFT_505863 [Pisolithus microcarpus 441]